MHPTTTISPLEAFQKEFPSTRVAVYDDELVYKVSNGHAAVWFEAKAQRIILENNLPLTAHLEEWGKRGFIFERTIVVKIVPEQHEVEQ